MHFITLGALFWLPHISHQTDADIYWIEGCCNQCLNQEHDLAVDNLNLNTLVEAVYDFSVSNKLVCRDDLTICSEVKTVTSIKIPPLCNLMKRGNFVMVKDHRQVIPQVIAFLILL